MKKIIAMLLVMVMAVSMIACGEAAPAKAPLEGTMSENVNKIMTEAPVEFMGGEIPVDLTDTSEDGLWALEYYTGLKDASKLSDIAVFEPMMMGQAFSLVMVRVAEGQDAKAVAQEMKDNIDPVKWVCVQADEVMVAGYGDVVMLIMLNTGMDLKAQSYVDAFAKICGAELDFTI